MKGHLCAAVIVLASVPIALAATGFTAAVASPGRQAPTPSASEPPWPSPSPSPSSSPSTGSDLDPERPSTNLIAVVDPIAVPVDDGFIVRVGARNSGPRSITAPAGQSAVGLRIVTSAMMGPARSLGGCQVLSRLSPNPTFPPEPYGFDCSSSARTLRVGETYWQSFVYHSLPNGHLLTVSGYAQDPDDRDNSRNIMVRAGKPGSGLPVTGPATISLAGGGLALVIAGTTAIWYSRRRRLGETGHKGRT